MKKNLLGILVLLTALFTLMLAGCGDTCTDDDTRACTTAYSSCTSACNPLSGYQACTEACKSTYCKCLDDAGCETSASGGTCN
jgi:hypothetical protein